MTFDIGFSTAPWPGLVLAITAGTIICTVLLVVMCSCCFKTKVPQYRAKLTKNVVAEEDIRRYTPQKRKFEPRGDTRMHSLIFDGAPIGSGRWDDLFITGGTNISGQFKSSSQDPHPNPPDVIMHPALLRVLNKESLNVTQREAIIVPTSSVASPTRPSHPSSSFQELIKQSQVDAGEEKKGTPLSAFPLRRDESQEFNRDGSIIHYKPRRDATPNDSESKSKQDQQKQTQRDQTRPDDPVASRIEELKEQRRAISSQAGNSPRLPRFNRISGEWDNVPKPRYNEDTPPPIPSRNYSIGESDIVTDCSETMPRPAIDQYAGRKLIDVERQMEQQICNPSDRSSRHSSRSSGASKRNLRHSPDSGRVKHHKNHINRSPISDTVFIPNENPAYSHRSVTPPGHTPRTDHRRYADDRLIQNSAEHHRGVMSDGGFDIIDEVQQPTQRHKRVDDVITYHHGANPRSFRPGVYYRPKPYYHHLKAPDKRYSDASDYSDVMYDRTNGYSDRIAIGDDPYFFRSRWSSAFEPAMNTRRHSAMLLNDRSSESRGRAPSKTRYDHQLSSNESSPERHTHDNKIAMASSPTQKSSRYHRAPATRQQIPLPEVPFRYNAPSQRRETSPPKRSSESRRNRRNQPPPPLQVVMEQHKDDVLVSPGHQPNYPVDVAKIRRGLQQSHSENNPRNFHRQQSAHCDLISSRKVDIVDSTTSLDKTSKRTSSDYGSLIDILYTYRQNVRKSRVKERPTESPESRLRFEREKLKCKLKDELQPRAMPSRNVEMVIETLLFLCETESSRDKKKRSWQRDTQSDTNSGKPRPNSDICVTPTDDNAAIYYGDYDIGNYDDNARSRNHSVAPNSFATESGGRERMPANEDNLKTVKPLPPLPSSEDFAVSQSPPPESPDKAFAFPTVEELDKILDRSMNPPPVPPRRNRNAQPTEDIPPPVAPRKPKTPHRNLPPTPMENSSAKIPNGEVENMKSQPDYSEIQHRKTEEPIESSGRKNDSTEPDYAKIRKKTSRKRRKSLPSRHLTEHELLWLQRSGGDMDELSTKQHASKFQGGKRPSVAQSTRVRAGAFLASKNLPSPPEPPIELKDTVETVLRFDDIHVDENTDAEDIIKQLERKMTENQTPLSVNNAMQSTKTGDGSPKFHSDSEMGTWSSVASSEIPVPTHRTRLQRFNGVSPIHNETPSQSPVFLRENFETPPPSGDIRHLDPVRADSISPIRNFRTPPATPRINVTKSLANSRRFISDSNVSVTPPLTPSPKVRHQPQQFSPSRRQSAINRPVSPSPTPSKKSLNPAGYLPNLSRRSPRFKPKIPVMSRRLIQPTSSHEIVVPMESDRRRVSRTGEIVYLPEDNDYALPIDAITTESSNHIHASHYPNVLSPNSPVFNLKNRSFYPIGDEDDYAVPVNQTPSNLLQQRIHSRSLDHFMSENESSV